ncbi:hypothetical protein V2I21_09020 [Campylobacter sp. CLAX-22107-21]|uniref:hypothetical protein n=1 Tax=Campylobacter devanensis TaxID=3161138 RepID=UPI002EB8843D|nr:hypothetical protein [Campylobacter sp. CLAX-22107-21]
MTAQRQLNVVYTNDTANPIMVSARDGYGRGGGMELIVDGICVSQNYGGKDASSVNGVEGIVPSGSTYKIISSKGCSGWTELGR